MMGLHRAALRGFAILAAVSAFGGTAAADKIKVIHSFCRDAKCADSGSGMTLVRDPSGNLYGTAGPGSSDYGSIFEMSPSGGKWTYRTLYRFSQGGGITPDSALIVDVDGNLYGSTTDYSERGGTIFKLSHNADGSAWKYKMLHHFVDDRAGFEGTLTYAGAAAGLPYDGVSPLYGPSAEGGRNFFGNVFSLTPSADGRLWGYKVVYSFCKRSDCKDGWAPFDTLTMDGAGNLYGATTAGGKAGDGLVFKLSPGAKSQWSNTVLYDFCAQSNCSDGKVPAGNSVTQDAAGNLYGTTPQGGTCPAGGCGVLYKIEPDGQENVLHAFCGAADCADGSDPSFGVSLGASGTVYGVTTFGGGHDQDPEGKGAGTIFSYDGKFHVLHSFCARTNCTDGAYPGPLVADSAGHFYGITSNGGATGHGTVFEFTP